MDGKEGMNPNDKRESFQFQYSRSASSGHLEHGNTAIKSTAISTAANAVGLL